MPNVEWQEFRKDLKEAKRKLYHLLLTMPRDQLESSESDADLCFALAKDPQMQEVSDEALGTNAKV